MDKNEYYKFKQIMTLRGLNFDWQRIDSVRHHNRGIAGETRKHWLCKCICSKILYDARHTHFTEFEFPNKAVADVYDMTSNVIIEFESVKNNKKESLKFFQFNKYVRDVFIFNIDDFPDDFQNIEKTIRTRLGL